MKRWRRSHRTLPMATAAKKKGAPKAADATIEAERAKAYAAMEPHLCAVVNMGTIASNPRSTCSSTCSTATTFRCRSPDPEAAAEIVIQRLIDAGFEIKGPGTGPIMNGRRRSVRKRLKR
jgi:hypothetical protein